MNFRRLLPALSLLALFALAGCVTYERGRGWVPRYYRVVLTDYRGHMLTEWIAQGAVRRTETGFRFRAVERYHTGPTPQSIRYPEGRIVDTAGPNLTVAQCAEPRWLYDRWTSGVRHGVMEE